MSIFKKWLKEFMRHKELPVGDKNGMGDTSDPDNINMQYSGEGPDSDDSRGIKQMKREEEEHKERLGEEL